MPGQPNTSTQVRQRAPIDPLAGRLGRHRRLWLSALLLVLLVGVSVAVLQQSQLGRKLQVGDQVVLPAGESWTGNLYATARIVRIAGRVDGDLVVIGGRVEVSGQVTGDVMAVASSVVISGQVEGDARLVTARLIMHGSIGGVVVAAGGMMHFHPSAHMADDLAFAAAHTTMGGHVTGDVLGASGHYSLSGTVEGTEGVTTGGEEAHIGLGERAMRALVRLASILGVATMLLWFMPSVVVGSAATLGRRPLVSFGIGALTLVGAVALGVALLLVVVLMAMALGLVGLEGLVAGAVFAGILILVSIGFLMFLVGAFAATAVVSLTVGSLLLRSEVTGKRPGALVVGTLVVVFLAALPEVGCWLALVVATFGIGGMAFAIAPRRRDVPAVSAPARS
jgi:hypothetical protein